MTSPTRRRTVAQAVVEFLTQQYSERDGVQQRLVAACFGIFGHGNVAGLGEALRQAGSELRYFQGRNEQAMVHAAAGYARMTNRLSALACTTSVGPGATNLVTGAAGATINRLPVLLLPGDVFASRRAAPVLQELEYGPAGDVSVNDCLRPVSKYWDRITRPEQLMASLPRAMHALTDPAETGAVTLALPEDVQAEAHDFPEELFRRRVWQVPRAEPDRRLLAEAAERIRRARRPLIVAGGGVIYSDATDELSHLVGLTGIPVCETQAGKGALSHGHPLALGGVGVTGTRSANQVAAQADLVIGIGTRWSDFTTASRSVFAAADVSFINLNVAAVDAAKHAGLALACDARAGLLALAHELAGYTIDADRHAELHRLVGEWDAFVDEQYRGTASGPPSQVAVIGALDGQSRPDDVVVCAAGSMPGELHRYWRPRSRQQYHVEYGYSCMGYEVAGGLGVKLASPDSEVFVLVGDGSYLMMSQELVTSIQEGAKLIVVLVDNRGYRSIGSLSRSVGAGGFGTSYQYRSASGQLDGGDLPVDLGMNAASLGAEVLRAADLPDLKEALAQARRMTRTAVIIVDTDPGIADPGYGWWDVPVAEVSAAAEVRAARKEYESAVRAARTYL